jgi:UMF1 family MFS transporter
MLSMIESQIARTGAETAIAQPHVITRRAVASWVLYDLANTIFSMGVISLIFPLWVQDAVGETRADPVYGIISAISMALIFVASPVLGAMTDRAPRRMPFLVVSTIICVVFTALLARGGFYLSALFFVVANIAYQAGLQFYDALLPEVSTEANRGKIGGIGVGVGYLGSYIAVGISIAFGVQNKPFLFLIIAITFLLFALPCFLFVRERGNPQPQPITFTAVRQSIRETIMTLRSGQRYPGLLRFLVGRVFYTDAINTVIAIMSLYTVNVAISTGLSRDEGQQQAQFILLSAITFAVAGGFFWGWLADKIGPKRTLNLVLMAWIAIFVTAALIGIVGLPLLVLYVVAACAGFSLGGVWAADRPYMLRLTPPTRIGEFYGLYGMVGRFSAITGPILWAIVTFLTIQVLGLEPQVGQGIGVIVLLGLVVISFIILQPVSDAPRNWQGTDLERGPSN